MYDEERIRAGMMFENSEDILESLNRKSDDTIFLGEGPRVVETYSTAWYYAQLLAWTLKCIITSPGWKIVSVHGYSHTEPVIRDVQTDYTKFESCIVDGKILVETDNIRLVITVNARPGGANFVQIEAGKEHHEMVKTLIRTIAEFLKKNNFYRGKKLNLERGISFLSAGQRDWDSVILDTAMKKEIRLNTIGFLKDCARLEKYGVPPKRGIILAGEPGTGKTIVCKALMSEAYISNI